MIKNYKLIPKELKAEILSAIDNSDYTIAEVAKNHNIPASRIYSWRSIRKKRQCNKISDNSSTPNNQFIELSVESDQVKHTILKKALLEFDNLSLSIEGKISPEKIMQLLKIMEVA